MQIELQPNQFIVTVTCEDIDKAIKHLKPVAVDFDNPHLGNLHSRILYDQLMAALDSGSLYSEETTIPPSQQTHD